MQEIIVASDLSERSRPAVRRAVNLAVRADAHLTVLNIVNEALPDSIAHQVEVGAKTILSQQVKEDVGTRELGFEVSVVVGDPVEEINKSITELKADLLIVGVHRRRTFLDQIRETTMEHLIRSSQIPILLVAKEAERAYQHVLCGVAFSGVCTAALRTIPLVAPDAKLTLFHAHEMSFAKEAEREFDTWKAIYPLPQGLPDPIYFEGKATDALEEILKSRDCDLITVGGHTRTDGGRYFIGRFTAGLIRNPPCDLLIGK